MKIITQVDSVWHNSNEELPTMSTDVEFIDTKGNIRLGKIVVDMAGHYCYCNDDNNWNSFSELIKWRFIPNKRYVMYENRNK